MADLELVLKKAYASTADSMRQSFTMTEIANKWQQLTELAGAIETIANFIGGDLTAIQAYRKAATDRLELHRPQKGAVAKRLREQLIRDQQHR